ncbi:hypothetical protein [Roseateles puraquae]|uniref:hypothetical protein n=1 Tax=Roseateles puraquae TaxID=431059 RepID=UPI001186A94C|nr:hypothetical protein [Roseateles puraquae]MDG0852304.1 hypothetical protein [Roseateles puraquae]
MNPKDQDRLLILAILVASIAALAYGGIAMVAWLVSRGVQIKEFDPAAWIQAVGSIAAIGALVWQRWHEVEMERKRAKAAAIDLQNGARRLVQAAAFICAEFSESSWPPSGKIDDAGCGLFEARLQALASTLKRVDAHALPRWQHTECVIVAISALEALHRELGRQVMEWGPGPAGLMQVRAALTEPNWLQSFRAMSREFRTQLFERTVTISQGLDPLMDPAASPQSAPQAHGAHR